MNFTNFLGCHGQHRCYFVPHHIFDDLRVLNNEVVPPAHADAIMVDNAPRINIETTPQALRDYRVQFAARNLIDRAEVGDQPEEAAVAEFANFPAEVVEPSFPVYDLDGATDLAMGGAALPEYKQVVKDSEPLDTQTRDDWPENAKNAQDIASRVHNFFKTLFKRDSIDDYGMEVTSAVRLRTFVVDNHFKVVIGTDNQPIRTGENNAFWDGQIMVFGEGDGIIFSDFTASQDVIGHELTHGVTGTTCRLAYRDQSGALNEHISDVFGIIFKQYIHLMTDPKAANWLIGEDCIKDDFKKMVKARKFGHWDALRSMKDPGTAYSVIKGNSKGVDRQPAHMHNYQNIEYDNGGVHINSGIPNKAFYEFAVQVGGPAWEIPGQIWYKTIKDSQFGNMQDGERVATFAQFRDATIAAAKQLYPGAEAKLTAAWQKVGL